MCKAGDLESAFELCKEIFTKRLLVDGDIMQEVVDELVKGSKREEAEEIVELAEKNEYLQFKLLPNICKKGDLDRAVEMSEEAIKLNVLCRPNMYKPVTDPPTRIFLLARRVIDKRVATPLTKAS
ncbi:hypothetical protein YC2023_038672 [Brassica napus]